MSEVTITVARSGGFAGLRREWRVIGEAEEWWPLVEACPWRSVACDRMRPDTESRDRFVYSIAVTAQRKRRQAVVPEGSLTGPWKTLVDRVKSA